MFLYGEPPEKEAIKSFIHQAIEEAVSAERKRIISRIEEEKSKGYEVNTILEGLIAELKVGISTNLD